MVNRRPTISATGVSSSAPPANPASVDRDAGRHARTGEGDDGVAERGADRQQGAQHDRRPGVGAGGDPDEQDQPGQGDDERDDGGPVRPAVPEQRGADRDEQRRQAEGDQRGDAHPGRRDGGEVGELVGGQPGADEDQPDGGAAGERGRAAERGAAG